MTEEQHQFQEGVLILADHVVIGFLPLLLDRYMVASEFCREVSSDGNVSDNSSISTSKPNSTACQEQMKEVEI